jgi:hypothetical protein
MVRISKQAERRAKCPHRCRPPAPKTGAKKDNLPQGYKVHANAAQDTAVAATTFISKIN